MKLSRICLCCVLEATVASAAEKAAPPNAPVPKKSSSEWVFELRPTSLQKNPRLDLTVITEMTEAGKKLPPVSPQAPTYFEIFSPGPKHPGHSQGNEVGTPTVVESGAPVSTKNAPPKQ